MLSLCWPQADSMLPHVLTHVLSLCWPYAGPMLALCGPSPHIRLVQAFLATGNASGLGMLKAFAFNSLQFAAFWPPIFCRWNPRFLFNSACFTSQVCFPIHMPYNVVNVVQADEVVHNNGEQAQLLQRGRQS